MVSCAHTQAEDRRPVGLQPTAYLSMVLLLSNTAMCHAGEEQLLSEQMGLSFVCINVAESVGTL